MCFMDDDKTTKKLGTFVGCGDSFVIPNLDTIPISPDDFSEYVINRLALCRTLALLKASKPTLGKDILNIEVRN